MSIDMVSLLNIAGQAGANISNTLSGLAALRALFNRVKQPPEIIDKMNTLSLDISQAQMQMAELNSRLLAFQSEQDTKQEIEERKRNYTLVETPGNVRVYRLKLEAETGEAAHDLCPHCFERDEIAILQTIGGILKCLNCKSDLSVPVPTGETGGFASAGTGILGKMTGR